MSSQNTTQLCELHAALRTIQDYCQGKLFGCDNCALYNFSDEQCRIRESFPSDWKVRETAEVIEVVKIFEEE